MKKILAFSLLSFCSIKLMSQESNIIKIDSIGKIPSFSNTIHVDKKISRRNYQDSSGHYQIKFEYNPTEYMIPTTNPPGEPHYFAKITVFKIITEKVGRDVVHMYGQVIGYTFDGYYTNNGCFEDESKTLVERAYYIARGKTKEHVDSSDFQPVTILCPHY